MSRGTDLVIHHPPSITTDHKTKLFPADTQIDASILIDCRAWSLNTGSNANLTNVTSHSKRNVRLTLILDKGQTFGFSVECSERFPSSYILQTNHYVSGDESASIFRVPTLMGPLRRLTAIPIHRIWYPYLKTGVDQVRKRSDLYRSLQPFLTIVNNLQDCSRFLGVSDFFFASWIIPMACSVKSHRCFGLPTFFPYL